MSNSPVQRGSIHASNFLFILAVGGLFLHGITSSLLLRQLDCAPMARVIDIVIWVLLILAACVLGIRISKRQTSGYDLRLWKIGVCLTIAYSLWIVIRGLTSDASTTEVMLSLALDTLHFWLFFIISIAASLATKKQDEMVMLLACTVGLLSLAAVAVYLFGQHGFDQSLGYGQCSSQGSLLVGGDSGWLRSRGFARNPNELGALLVIPFVLLFRAVILNVASRRRGLYAVSFGAVTTLLYLSFSRSAWLATGAGLVIVILIDDKLWLSIKALWKWLTAVLVVVSVIFVAIAGAGGLESLFLHRGSSSDSTALHATAKLQGIEQTLENPLGSGPGSAGAVGAALQNGPYTQTESAYLDVSIQYGLVGLVFQAGLLYVILRMLLLSNHPYSRPVLASVAGLMYAALFIPVWSNFTVTITMALFAGLATKLPSDKK